jgi:cell division protein FtsI (penicillin-binding protein 3)
MESATLPAGTAHRAAVEGVRISAKTGTAQVANARTGSYSESDFVASIMGIFPTDDPRLIVYVVVQNPRGQSYYGSQIAAPIFRDVAVSLMDKLGIARAGTRISPTASGSTSRTPVTAGSASPTPAPAGSASAAGSPVPPTGEVTVGSAMPTLLGTPKKLLLPLLLRKDLVVTINGSGYVVSQDPPPGTRIQDGMKIDLELR